jgi:KaiC/GvpD/RAD55 family RecA-like ATPase
MAVTFLYNGTTKCGEPGVFMTFEERPSDLVQNVSSLRFDLDRLIAEKKLATTPLPANAIPERRVAGGAGPRSEIHAYDIEHFGSGPERLRLSISHLGD